MNEDAYIRFRKVLGDMPVQHDQELGALRPNWTVSHDPQTGVIIISYTPELMMAPREIDKVGEIVQMRLHELRQKWGSGS